jgi:molybdenum cofactor cytidylyltransferase
MSIDAYSVNPMVGDPASSVCTTSVNCLANRAAESRLLLAILAAGASRRLGQPKQLVELGGESLLRRQCRIAIEARLGPAAVILGCQATECAATIVDLPVARYINQRWAEGLGSSIRRAAEAAMAADATGLLLLHVDQYRLTAADLHSLHNAWLDSHSVSACVAMCGDYFGPPVIFPRSCFAELLKLDGDAGARGVLAALPANALRRVRILNAINDLDSPEQLAALTQRR